ncbi:MAG: O-antigen ligase family protein [Opitutales bacterium]
MPTLNDTARNIDYFGEFSWANLLDWMVTLCLGGILALTALQMGGVRPETQLMLQPLYIVLLVLHGLSLAVSRQESRRLNPLPFLFIPFLLWAFASVLFWTPTPWRGSYELSYFFTAFLFGWVTVNNVRTRAHLWALVILSLAPVGMGIFIGYYQFFQDPSKVVDVWLGYPVELSAGYFGQATGLFADPGSFAAFLLILLPCFIIAGFVPRLPFILKVLCLYVALMLVVGIALTQVYWAAASVVVTMAVVPWFCFEKKKRRYLFSVLGVSAALAVFLLMYLFSPPFERGLANALSPEGEGVRLVFWKQALDGIAQSPMLGNGAGSFSLMIEKSAEVSLAELPLTPHNDFLLILSNYGLIGGCLLFIPMGYILYRALRRWSKESFTFKSLHGPMMSTQKFFLSLAICGVVALLLSASMHFLLYVPALLLYGVLMFSILVKSSFRQTVSLPVSRFYGMLYLLVCSVVGFTFWAHTSQVTESQGLEMQARQRLESLVEQGIGVSGNFKIVDRVIEQYEDALITDSNNADAWIGLSMAICQLHYRDPAEFERTGTRAARAAGRAYAICPEYWLASAQLGVAHALSGQVEEARTAFTRAIELAPNVSNAHYYYAAFLGADSSTREKAVEQVRRALEIDPGNAPARRLEQKLRIL